jgi:hypothetical protein
MEQTTYLLNFVACCITSIVTVVLLYRLHMDSHAHFRFVFRSFVCWSAAWAVWCVLWGIRSFVELETYGKIILLCLSDVNTIFVILFYRGLTRGKKYGIAQYALEGVLLAIVVSCAVLAFYALGWRSVDIGFSLHEKWSVALGMCSPVIVGWALHLRYNTMLPLAVGFTYALAQPAAHEALLDMPLD